MKTEFKEIPCDQLKENDVCAISVQLVSVVEDKQPIKSVVSFTLSRDLTAQENGRASVDSSWFSVRKQSEF